MQFPVHLQTPCLVIDTSSNIISISLHINDKFDMINQNCGNNLTKNLLPIIDHLLKKNFINIKNIKYIIYSKGPGSFTSLRIGLAIAKGVAFPFNIPLVGIPKLDVIASQAKFYNITEKLILSYISTTKNEFFYAVYDSINFTLQKYYNISMIDNVLQKLDLSSIFAIGDVPLNYLNLKNIIFNPNANDYFNQATQQHYKIYDSDMADLLYIKNKIAFTRQELLNNEHKKSNN